MISDTIANDIYYKNGMYFIPQQSGTVRKLPFKLTTFCYHPNNMTEKSFIELETFIKNNRKKIMNFSEVEYKKRKFSIVDKLLKILYFSIRKIK